SPSDFEFSHNSSPIIRPKADVNNPTSATPIRKSIKAEKSQDQITCKTLPDKEINKKDASHKQLTTPRHPSTEPAPINKALQTDVCTTMDVDTVSPTIIVPPKTSPVTPVTPPNKVKAEPMQDIIFNEPNPWIDVVPAHSSPTVDNKKKIRKS